jgi:hypothetical protein
MCQQGITVNVLFKIVQTISILYSNKQIVVGINLFKHVSPRVDLLGSVTCTGQMWNTANFPNPLNGNLSTKESAGSLLEVFTETT